MTATKGSNKNVSSKRLSDLAVGRDNHFNLIRMIAASGVLLSHSWPITQGAGTLEPLQDLLGHKLGTLCVFVFFAISGFFITRSFDMQPHWRRFMAARLLRLFPGLTVMLVLTVSLGAVMTQADTTYWPEAARYFFNNLLLKPTQYELADLFQTHALSGIVNGSLWSLWYEFFCYLTVLILGITGILQSKHYARALPILMIGLCLLLHYWNQTAPTLGLPYFDDTYTHVGLPFAIGAAFYVWRSALRLSWGALLALSLLAWVVRDSFFYLPVLQLTLAYGCFCLGYAPLPALLRYNRLGDYSYGLYIYAFPIQQLISPLTPPDQPLFMAAWAFILSLIMAVASWHLIEQPTLRLKDRL